MHRIYLEVNIQNLENTLETEKLFEGEWKFGVIMHLNGGVKIVAPLWPNKTRHSHSN